MKATAKLFRLRRYGPSAEVSIRQTVEHRAACGYPQNMSAEDVLAHVDWAQARKFNAMPFSISKQAQYLYIIAGAENAAIAAAGGSPTALMPPDD